MTQMDGDGWEFNTLLLNNKNYSFVPFLTPIESSFALSKSESEFCLIMSG